jgi:hypothetical protein
MSHGRALKMMLELSRLLKLERDVDHAIMPLAPPADTPMILSGLASTTDVDRERVRFRARAFDNVRWASDIPFLLRHDPAVVAGRIEDLCYDDRGNLLVRAKVDDPLARRMPAYSIRAEVLDYRIDEAEAAAVVTRASLVEISMTDRPCNPNAIVQSRYPPSAGAAHYAAIGAKLDCLMRLTKFIQQEVRA